MAYWFDANGGLMGNALMTYRSRRQTYSLTATGVSSEPATVIVVSQ